MKTLALIIRGKVSEAHDPDLMAQHADVVLSDGAPIGYFGEGSGFSAEYGMFMDGVVYNYETLRVKRPPYVDAQMAAQVRMISTICTIKVDDGVAKKFDEYWQGLAKKEKAKKLGFNILGNNCSTNAAAAFRHAGVLDEGIPGLDTPQNLYMQLKSRYSGSFACTSGYIGFKQVGSRFEMELIPVN